MRSRRFVSLVLQALALGGAAGCGVRASRPAAGPGAPGPTAAAATAPSGSEALPRTDRWQVELNNGEYLYEVRLVGSRGDSLLTVLPDGPKAIALADIDELRLVQASVKAVGGPRNTFGALAGADDTVYKLSRFEPEARRRIVEELLRERATDSTARP